MLKRRYRGTAAGSKIEPHINLWVLRILVDMGAHRELIGKRDFNDDDIAAAVGLESMAYDEDNYSPRTALKLLREQYALVEESADKIKLPKYLNRNIKRLSQLVGLNETDCQILSFAICMRNSSILDDAADLLRDISTINMYRAFAVILDLDENDVRASLSAGGVLSASGLMTVDNNGSNRLSRKFDLISDSFADLMLSGDTDPVNLLSGTVDATPAPELSLDEYNHLDQHLDILLPYLKHVQTTQKKGVNIYLYGVPGTGKTQLVRALAQKLNSELFEVATEDDDGDPIKGERRIRAFKAGQCFFAKRRSLIVFDEAEDVFNDGDFLSALFSKKSTAQVHKGWINKNLESNPVPTFWISNTARGLDPAFVRRFDMVLELPIPPMEQRAKLLRNVCGDLLDDNNIKRFTEIETLAPAVVTRAGDVVRAVSDKLTTTTAAEAFELLVNNTLQVQGHQRILKNNPNRLPAVYDPAFINTDIDLLAIAAGIKNAGSARICLYGAPGTGKTAYARWLAAELGKSIIIKRASDLLSKYVGESEQNIATAFIQAETEDALLLIDEVDSFLHDRNNARHSWETTLVNEMLTQIESFSGVLVVTTNIMENLDKAALRRFDLKAKFGYLPPEQSTKLFLKYCNNLGLPQPDAAALKQIASLQQLAPGDFAAVAHQNRFNPFKTPEQLIAALENECKIKGGVKNPIGFL